MVLDAKDKEIAKLKKENEKLQKMVDKTTAKKASKTKKKPSAYNEFMSKEIPLVKKANPEISHTDAFKKAVENWKSKSGTLF